MKADDDIYVDTDMTVEYLAQHGHEHCVMGNAWLFANVAGVLVDKLSALLIPNKNTVPHGLYGGTTYPPYVSGVSYTMSRKVVKRVMYAAEHLLPALFVEDLYLTGFAAQYANVSICDVSGTLVHLNLHSGCAYGDLQYFGENMAIVGDKCSPKHLKEILYLKRQL